MKADASGRRQRAVMATDAEWERIARAAAAPGMELSRYVVHRALEREDLGRQCTARARLTAMARNTPAASGESPANTVRPASR